MVPRSRTWTFPANEIGALPPPNLPKLSDDDDDGGGGGLYLRLSSKLSVQTISTQYGM